ncbi:lipid kinase, YegS/Rv2252/BmrU family [Prevotella aff. ruminicola Tc2-24]|uniref:Lipid kinase, YegS/Rv2252/BmrU family n=1 Tax=Prevotella aff. ruminicola Tc2-24 TaxID=81582 RepID=A0A1I0MKG2_9BACT|nr:diacylglycerol kinase family protein [Prevotella aff. ruminicola Tc2-24]SEV88891.1 lipid kinase, YegS/Rv2252/BmrU family [Prevotella aff. ruminicola Tc2-24]
MAVEPTRWAILYCPKAGISNKRKRWEKIQKVLDEHKVEYDFVQSETANSVERLMRMLISNGYKTIIIVGGDSALNDAVNCLMAEEKAVRDSIALGVIPNGIMNDFARFWGFEEDKIEQTVEWLQKRRIRTIDLGCIRYQNAKGERCHRYFLNCINIGMTADIMNLRRQTRRLFGSRTLSFISSLFVMLFHRMEYKMKLKINNDVIERKVMTMCVGSGPGYGQTPNAVPYNGMLDVSVVYHPEVVQLLEGLWLLVTGRFLNHRSVHPYRTREVFVDYAKRAMVGIDGRLMKTPKGSYRIDIEQEVINFLIPE